MINTYAEYNRHNFKHYYLEIEYCLGIRILCFDSF